MKAVYLLALLNIFMIVIIILNRSSILYEEDLLDHTIVTKVFETTFQSISEVIPEPVFESIPESIPNSVPETEEVELSQIALTFDDGPHPQYTPKLLEGLKERNVKATFFVTGQNVALYPELIKEIDKDGHLIGNHTYTHLELREDNREKFIEELLRTNEIIKEVIQKETEYVRPPFGRWNEDLEKEIMMFPVFWTIDPLDWCTPDAGKVIRRVVGKIQENDIILLHDCYGTTVDATLKIIDILQGKGYEFVTVDQIILE